MSRPVWNLGDGLEQLSYADSDFAAAQAMVEHYLDQMRGEGATPTP
jgi:hypothetical protein